jgi:Protein of unknown function (DUF2934)
MPDREERIRERAHQIWEREGRPVGKDSEHWERACREIDAEDAHPKPEESEPSRGPAPGSAAGEKRTRTPRSRAGSKAGKSRST